MAKSGKSITPEIVRKGDPTVRMAIMLADIYHEGRQWQRSFDLCNRLLGSAAIGKATPDQRSYVHFKRARNHYRLGDSDAALEDYVAAVHCTPQAPWASEAMFLAGNIQWNIKHNADAAVSVWNRLIHDYPESREAGVSTMFISVVYRWTNRPDAAKKVLTGFLAKHPDSPLAEAAQKQLTKVDPPPHGEDKPGPQPADGVKTGSQQKPS